MQASFSGSRGILSALPGRFSVASPHTSFLSVPCYLSGVKPETETGSDEPIHLNRGQYIIEDPFCEMKSKSLHLSMFTVSQHRH
jgi:hypothetical protein